MFFLQSVLASKHDKREVGVLSDPKGKCPLNWDEGSRVSLDVVPTVAWSKPEGGWAKLNWDANFWEEENRGGWGAILRNDYGKVLLTAWGKVDNCNTAKMAETSACLQSVKAILPNFPGRIHLENDCFSLISELKGEGSSKSEISGTVTDIICLLNSMQEFKVSKINRSGNIVAHHLARMWRRGLDDAVLVGSAPPCVVSLIDLDCNVLNIS